VQRQKQKTGINTLALFGGPALFDAPRSTSNLLKPDIEKFLCYSRQFYDAGQYTNNGPVAKLLEKRLAEFHEAEHCRVFASGFWAIALAMRCLALEGRDEVIMPSLTYRRMADIAAWIPLKPHYCEVDPYTLAMTPDTVEACITENTALILGVHPIVNCCDAKGLEDLGTAYDIPVMFDSVESIYEVLPEGRVGGFGEAECFSLHACKLLNGFGGGYLTSNNPDLVKKLTSLRNFGFTKHGVSLKGGLNAKLNEMHAAMTLASLDDLKEQVLRNRNSYEVYKLLLANISGIRLIAFDEERQSGFKNIVVELTEDWPLPRDVTIKILNAENILARAHYAPPLHQKTIHIPHVASTMPVTESLAERFLNMPCGQRTSVRDIKQIVNLMKFLEKHADTVLNRLKEVS
jgi:dTDP-4-amino-4,6-dideoxygalactose transaminase